MAAPAVDVAGIDSGIDTLGAWITLAYQYLGVAFEPTATG